MVKNNKTELMEVKKGSIGSGLLLEHDGYISMSDENNKSLNETINVNGEWNVPHPFIVSAVFQKFGIKNANGRIYPEHILKREVEKYQQRIRDRRAAGECYTPDVLVLTKTGWKEMANIVEGEEVLTLNVETNNIEIQKVVRKIEYDYDGDMIRIKNRNFNDLVTPNHGYPLYRNNEFKGFYTAEEIHNKTIKGQHHYYIPKRGNWVEKGEDFYIIKGCKNLSNAALRIYPYAIDDLKIPMSTFMKFMGIYLSEGDYGKYHDVRIHQKKENICEEIEELLQELGLKYSIYQFKSGKKVFKILDPRLKKYVEQFGNCYTKYIPVDIKNQSKENLRILYDWFVKGDGRSRGKGLNKRNEKTDDVFSTSKQLLLDLNEIQLKIGYSGNVHYDERNYDRYFGERIIKAENQHTLYYSFRSLTNGIYLDERMMKTEKEYYKGKVMCIEVPNHTFYVMSNGKCHWSKNCDHPEHGTIALDRISHNIIELHWVGRTLVGKLEINTSHGFRKYGICSTLGDMAANMLMNGYRLGVSSRAMGSVEKDRMGNLVVGNDLELLCWDIVYDPSTPLAYIDQSEEALTPFIESKETSNNTILSEKISKLKNILNN